MEDRSRCGWHGQDPIYRAYHDTEWGVPETESRALWEKLILDGFQAGLSWITILKKRDNFRDAFAGFESNILASWSEKDVVRLLQNPGIIRHRGKIEAALSNARVWQKIEHRVGFANNLWAYVQYAPVINHWESLDEVPNYTPLSANFKRFKGRGI